ncbi:MAG TPA: hypothetical protein ENH29_05025 [Bacteroidetes bacterium]|nr:hypothetical protein [Bacteroidota bacterium]
MKYSFFFCILLVLNLVPDRSQSQYLTQFPKTDSLVALGIKQIHNLQLDSSLATFDRLIAYFPEHPIGYFYKAGVYDLFNQDYRITTFEKQFEKNVNLAIKKGEKYIKKNKNDELAYFYLGGAYGFRGIHRVYKRDWLHVFIDGIKGLKNLNKSLKKRPDFYDAYFGLGLYHYWRSALTKKFRFLPFISDQRQRGINELKLAIEKGRYAGVEARISLSSVYYNETKYDSALIVNNWLHSHFPNDPSILYFRTRIFERQQNWRSMLATAKHLLEILMDYQYKSYGYLVECHYLQALPLYHLGEKEKSLVHLETAIRLEKLRNKKKELEGPNEDFKVIFKNVKKLRKKIQKGK